MIIRLMIVAMVGLSPTVATVHADTPRDSMTRQLGEVVVTGTGAQRNLHAPQMGQFTMTDQYITSLPVMFAEPDIVKALQAQPGVSQGVEGFTGMYVRGGDNDQNLFLYQGIPLYHVSHLGGIFSSFNVATISKVDFFKSSFPARYGGRISSITDMAMRQPDFEKFTGRFSIGLLSANAYISGPIVRGRTAFSAAIRRSWLDVISVPAVAIWNVADKKNGLKHMAHYAFTDFNARLDHCFNDRTNIFVVGYYGHDRLKIGERTFNPLTNENMTDDTHNLFYDEDVNRLSWGNWGIISTINHRLGGGILTASVYYSDYSSTYRQEKEYQSDLSDPDSYGYSRSRTDNSIRDLGVNATYSSQLHRLYGIRGGIGYIHHDYLPEGLTNSSLNNGEKVSDNNTSPRVKANELYAYIENTLDFGELAALNLGARGVMYTLPDKTRWRIEPRVAIRLNITDTYSVKAAYSRMTQMAQQVSSNYINLPTDLWQPISSRFAPLTSDQYSLGLYGSLPWSVYFSVEGWYKEMMGLLEYREGISVINPSITWEEKLTSGDGHSYGIDISITREAGRLTGSIGYGLMWNRRKFKELNLGREFLAKFDNRHKININASYRLNDKIEFNAGWIFMTGNRLTLSLYNYTTPDHTDFPDAPLPDHSGDGIDYYSGRNDIRMPPYHRLDLGISLRHKTKHGHNGIWNFSIYNAYCRMNPITIRKETVLTDYGTSYNRFSTLSLIPIVPSVSYTYSF